MLLFDKSQAEIWRMLLPGKFLLYPKEEMSEDLIFYYRNFVYFVHEDGAVVRIKKPHSLLKLEVDDLWELLFRDHETFDFEDQGIFTIGAILRQMGYMALTKMCPFGEDYHVIIVDGLNPELVIEQFDICNVSFQYALYYSLLKCHELDELTNGELEHEIQQIIRVGYKLDMTEPLI